MNEIKTYVLNYLSTLSLLNADTFSRLRNNIIQTELRDNNTSVFYFSVELLKAVIGWEKLKSEIYLFLSLYANSFDNTIKYLLKRLIKSNFSCSNDGLIPDYLFDSGVNMSIKKLDFFNIFRIDPVSDAGKVIYTSPSDLDTAIYNAIKTPDITVNYKNILLITYTAFGVVAGKQTKDVINVKVSTAYRQRTLNDFLNDLINSTVFVTSFTIISKGLDNMFGILSKGFKNKEDISKEQQINSLLQKIIDLENETYDNSYFNFNSTEIETLSEKINQLNQGLRNVQACSNFDSSIQSQTVYNFFDEINTSTLENNIIVIENYFDILSNEATQNAAESNRYNAKLEFISSFFKGILLTILQKILSPKFLLILTLLYRINNTELYQDAKDFILKNKVFIRNIVISIITPILMKFIKKVFAKYLQKIILKDKANRLEEASRYYTLQLRALTGTLNIT